MAFQKGLLSQFGATRAVQRMFICAGKGPSGSKPCQKAIYKRFSFCSHLRVDKDYSHVSSPFLFELYIRGISRQYKQRPRVPYPSSISFHLSPKMGLLQMVPGGDRTSLRRVSSFVCQPYSLYWTDVFSSLDCPQNDHQFVGIVS